MSLFNYRRLFMAELSRNMLRLKRVMNKSKNRNTRFVNVRSVRNCKYCGEQIGVGDECLTTNKKLEGRRWTCLGCLDAILRYNETKAELDNVAFGDEGASMALSEALDENLAELYERGIIDED